MERQNNMMMYDIPKLKLDGLDSFFGQAESLDLPARQQFFYDLYPYAEQIPGSFALLSPKSEILACNEYSWRQIHLENIKQLADHTSAEAEMLLNWPRDLVGQAMRNDQIVLEKGVSIHEEIILQGNQETTLICRKEAVYNAAKNPLGILCVCLATQSTTKKIKLVEGSQSVQIKLNNEKSIRFSRREFLTLQFLLQGLSSAQISSLLSISSKTIETYVYRIKEKLGCDKQREILALMLKHDLATQILNFEDLK